MQNENAYRENRSNRTEGYKEYISHPSFEFDGGKAGMWVGKYEPSGSASLVIIKPNATTIRNTEWGPVSYLAENKYRIVVKYFYHIRHIGLK